MFENRRLLIATKHEKEKVLAPLLEAALGVRCFVAENYDTDRLGTFTGEIERTGDPISTAREKCLQAMELHQCDLGVASEGSFGPHPSIFFVKADDEFLIFIDRLNQIEVVVRELSTNTNFNQQSLRNRGELREFARSAGFPAHGIILRKSPNENTDIHKGIRDEQTLHLSFEQLLAKHGEVYAETDMRAMHNPTRMEVIAQAAQKLVDKIQSACPECQTRGFGINQVKQGLPCAWCQLPTKGVLSHVYVCAHCNFTQEVLHPHGKMSQDPSYCDRCNP